MKTTLTRNVQEVASFKEIWAIYPLLYILELQQLHVFNLVKHVM